MNGIGPYRRLVNVGPGTGLCMTAQHFHYNDVMMGAMASQITNFTIVYSTVYSRHRWKKYQSSASLASVRGIHLWPVKSPQKWPVTRKMYPFDDVIMSERHMASLGHNESMMVSTYKSPKEDEIKPIIWLLAYRKCTAWFSLFEYGGCRLTTQWKARAT